MKNKIEDLRNHLFAQLEKLADDDCKLETEIQRATSMCQIAEVIIESARAETDFLDTIGSSKSTGFFNDLSEKKLLKE